MKPATLLSFAMLLAAATWADRASAETTCSTVAAFNDAMAAAGTTVTTAVLRFDVTGANPADYPGTKGCLAEFADSRCAAGAIANLKLYGIYDPPNTAHPPGTLKLEYGTACCAAPPCGEGWADPGTSAQIFVDGTEHCTVTMTVDPSQIGYSLDCGGTLYEATGDNNIGLSVDEVAVLRRNDGGWAMPSATSTWNEICYEVPVVVPSGTAKDLPVLEDVTVAADHPDAVYPAAEDLCSEAAYDTIYLKFDARSVPGRIEKARIFLHRSNDPSANGDGGDAYAVPSNAWSETTLTWNTRPPTAGASLDRVSPVANDVWYGWDVSAAMKNPAVYSFAIVPGAADQNGAHFFSKEGSTAQAPYLHVEYVVIDSDGDGQPDGPDCDDSNPAVHPGAVELCNGIDDNCDGQVDEGCTGGTGGGGAGGGGAGGGGTGGASAGGSDPGDDAAQGPPAGVGVREGGAGSGAGCAWGRGAPPERTAWPALLAAIGLALGAARRRRA